MPERPLSAIVLAAGLGTRMRSARAKVLHELAGRPLIRYPLAVLRGLGSRPVVLVVGHQASEVERAAADVNLTELRVVKQGEQRGTGHAVACGAEALRGFRGDVLLLYGDVPLIRAETLRALVALHRDERADVTLVTVKLADASGYGRVIRDAGGQVTRIVEERDTTPETRTITQVNAGIYVVRAEVLPALLGELRPSNAQGELYLTDIVALASKKGLVLRALHAPRPDEVLGVNTRAELARMEAYLRGQLIEHWMAEGVTFEDPATVYLGPDVTIGTDTVIGPNVHLYGATHIGAGCRIDGSVYLVDTKVADRVHIRFSCTAEEAEIGAEARVGPFARLRPGTRLGARVHVGNFVETKQAVLGTGAKANHLTYLGDCEIGADTNIGAGTITCNFDGVRKHRTVIGARVQIGSDTQLVAPVKVADDAYVGAGTTVTRDVPAGALAVTRVPMRVVTGWTARRLALGAEAASPVTDNGKALSRAHAKTRSRHGKVHAAKKKRPKRRR